LRGRHRRERDSNPRHPFGCSGLRTGAARRI